MENGQVLLFALLRWNILTKGRLQYVVVGLFTLKFVLHTDTSDLF